MFFSQSRIGSLGFEKEATPLCSGPSEAFCTRCITQLSESVCSCARPRRTEFNMSVMGGGLNVSTSVPNEMIGGAHITVLLQNTVFLFLVEALCIFLFYCCQKSGHMTYFLLSVLERDPPLLLSWRVLHFVPPERFFYIFWEFFLIRCKVKGQGCRMCTDCKALWGKFVICDFRLMKIIWI